MTNALMLVVPGTVCDRWVEWNLTGRLVGDCPLIV